MPLSCLETATRPYLATLAAGPSDERRERLDVRCEQLVNQPAAKVEALRIRLAGPVREDPGPSDGEAVCFRSDRSHELHVLLVPMIVVIGDIAIVIVFDFPGRVCVRVPDRFSLAILPKKNASRAISFASFAVIEVFVAVAMIFLLKA
jgi:hypothetical protein